MRELTVEQAADRLGVSPGRVRQLLVERRIIGATQVAGVWLIRPGRDGLPRVKAVRQGRPAKPKRTVRKAAKTRKT